MFLALSFSPKLDFFFTAKPFLSSFQVSGAILAQVPYLKRG
jgi:hypothetical protein